VPPSKRTSGNRRHHATMTSSKCADCGAEFPTLAALTEHRRMEHRATGGHATPVSHVPAYECPLCDGEFPSDEELRRHALHAHPVTQRPPAMPEDPARPDKKGPPIVT
jgi:hypothetical protein